MRTYAGHSTAVASNALYRKNLEKGQTGLSVAFDLPTQTGYDPDDPFCRGEVGKVGVPVSHLGDMRELFRDIPLGKMNTSMTINATAPWLLALYIALAEEQGVDAGALTGTTQNDIIKEYLSRGTHIFPPAASLRLVTDVVTYTVEHVPKWNPVNICSYHLQEAGATPEQELAYALLTSIAVLDEVRARGVVHPTKMAAVVGRISFFVNAGIRFVDEVCKMRAFVELWDRLTKERYGVASDKDRRLRYGVQVNSLGLTEQQPENNIIRIVLEMLAVTLSKNARARAVQLPAWNEALGLPKPWDQQWSLRAQQILAFESDLLEHEDIFDGSHVINARVRAIADGAWAEIESVLSRGPALAAVETGYIKQRLVESNAARLSRIESGEQVVVGVNRFTEGESSALTANLSDAILTVDPAVEAERCQAIAAWRQARDQARVDAALAELKRAAVAQENIMPASIAAARVGVTTGEWAGTLRGVFGEYRAPTGVAGARMTVERTDTAALAATRARMTELTRDLGRRPKLLVGKPGLDGHSNGAEQIAIKARDAGFEVVYEGIRVSPEHLASAALEEGVHVVGLSILSGSHMTLVPAFLQEMSKRGIANVPVVVGGIIPEEDEAELLALGVAAVFTPKDFQLDRIMDALIEVVRKAHEK